MPLAIPLAIGGAAVIGAGASIGSAIIGSNAAKDAAQIQAQSASNALDLQKQEFATGQQNLQPYLNLGAGASGQLSNLFGMGGNNGGKPDYSAFYNSPDFQFAQSQGNLGVSNYLASTGQTQGAAGLQAVSNFNQGLASQQFGNYFNRLLAMTQIGSGAAGQSAQLAAQGGQTMGNTIQGIGQANASGIIGSANAQTAGLTGAGNAVGGAANNLMLYSLLSKNPSAYNPTALGSAGPGSGDSLFG